MNRALLLLLIAAPTWARPKGDYPAVTVDPRLELLAVVHVLANEAQPSEGFDLNDSEHAAQVKKAFGKFAKHPVVAAYRAAQARGLNAVEAQKLMLDLTPPPELKPARTLHFEAPEFLDALRAFASESSFDAFFKARRPSYDRWIKEVRNDLKTRDYAAMIEEYTGLPVTCDYTFMLVALRDKNRGNMNHIECRPKRDGQAITSALGPVEVEGGEPIFRISSRRWDMWHELGHTLLDRRLLEFPEEVARTSVLYDRESAPCYNDWTSCVREHMAQGLATRMLAWAQESGRTKDDAGASLMAAHRLPYLGLIAERLKEFEGDRKKYPTIAAFYPRLLAVFTELSDKSGKKAPPSSGVVDLPKGDCALEFGGQSTTMAPLQPPEKKEGLAAVDLRRRGVWAFTHGDAPGALADFKAAVAADPADPEGHLDLSVVLAQRGELKGAMKSAEQAVERSSAMDQTRAMLRADALSNRAGLRKQAGSGKKAKADWLEALRVAPSNWPHREDVEKELSGP